MPSQTISDSSGVASIVGTSVGDEQLPGFRADAGNLDHLLIRLNDRADVSTPHDLPGEWGTNRRRVNPYLQVDDGLLGADVVARLTVNLRHRALRRHPD